MTARRRATWALFVAALFVVPVLFYLIWDVGMVPLACIIARFLPPILVLPFRGEIRATLASILFLAVHVVFDGALLGVAAILIGRLVFWLCPARLAGAIVAVLIAAGVTASFWPVYQITGERDVVSVTLPQVWRQFVMGEPPPPRPHPAREPSRYPAWLPDPYCDPVSGMYDADRCRSRHPNE